MVIIEMKTVIFHPIFPNLQMKPIQSRVTKRNPRMSRKKAYPMREASAKTNFFHRIPCSQTTSLLFAPLLKVRAKRMRPKIPRDIPHPNAISPGPGADREPGPSRIDSTQIAIAIPIQKKLLIRSNLAKPYTHI